MVIMAAVGEMSTIQSLSDYCVECGSENLIHDYVVGEVICNNCGLVVQDAIIDKGPEWRAFTPEEKRTKIRVGSPTSYFFHDKGLSTTIGPISRDKQGKKLPLTTRIQMRRLKKWQARSRVNASISRNLNKANLELDRLSDRLSIPRHVKEKAMIIYRKTLNRGIVQGRSITTIIAASLYAACRITDTPRNLREIAKASSSKWKAVARGYRLLIRELDIHMPTIDPKTYLSKISSKANISVQTQGLAAKIIQKAKDKRALAGKDPIGLAAAALYIACKKVKEKKTQKDVAAAAGITEVTIRNRYSELKKQLDL